MVTTTLLIFAEIQGLAVGGTSVEAIGPSLDPFLEPFKGSSKGFAVSSIIPTCDHAGPPHRWHWLRLSETLRLPGKKQVIVHRSSFGFTPEPTQFVKLAEA